MNGTYAVSFSAFKKLQIKSVQFDVFSSALDAVNIISDSVAIVNDPTAIIKYVGLYVDLLFNMYQKNGPLHELNKILTYVCVSLSLFGIMLRTSGNRITAKKSAAPIFGSTGSALTVIFTISNPVPICLGGVVVLDENGNLIKALLDPCFPVEVKAECLCVCVRASFYRCFLYCDMWTIGREHALILFGKRERETNQLINR